MAEARSHGKIRVARAIWYAAPGKIEIRPQQIPMPRPGLAQVKTLFTAVSRGTERLVAAGAVGKSEWERMRAPLQEGNFPFPVKYGYCAVGTVTLGPAELEGKTVFCLHPHQDYFNVETNRLTVVPDNVPARRATLTANMETALNALWDAGAGPADRIVVVGAGIVGLLVAALAARMPGSDVTIVDVQDRSEIAAQLGFRFAHPDSAPTGADIVFHASAHEKGLETAIRCAGFEGKVVEMSWYGQRPVTIGLGDAFHSQRLHLISTQVGHVSAGRRPRWDYGRRIAAALRLLDDARLDVLTQSGFDFDDAAEKLPAALAGDAAGLAPVIRYPD